MKNSSCELEQLFNDVGLYSPIKFNVLRKDKDNNYILDKGELDRMYKCLDVNAKNKNITTLCNKCKMRYPFLIDIIYKNFFYGGSIHGFNIGDNIILDINSGLIFGAQPPYKENKLIKYGKWYLEYYFKCTKNEKHEYFMVVSIEYKDGTFIVTKVGQDPSMFDVHGFDFDIYKKELSKINAYDDYKKANLSYADGFYVGSFAYLRRVFEKLVNKYIDESEEKPKDNHMETKINFVKERFDIRIRGDLKNLYEVLSVSIHELYEDESKEYYDCLKAVIDIQLEYEKTESEKEKQSQILSKTLNKIHSNISLKKKTQKQN